jgi:hypothetical protein
LQTHLKEIIGNNLKPLFGTSTRLAKSQKQSKKIINLRELDALGGWTIDRQVVVKTSGEWRPFSFANHEYLLELYGLKRKGRREVIEDPKRWDLAPYVVLQKAAQVGASTYAINRQLWLADHQDRTIIYFFHTDQDVRDFSNERFRETVYQTPYLIETIGRIDNVHQVALKNSWIYFRGMESKARTKSIPGDSIVFDELDEANPKNKDQARHRIKHSDLRWITELSTPTVPDYGIDIEFKRSDQRYYIFKCRHCKTWTCLEDEFFEGNIDRILIVDKKHPNGFRACKKCGKPLNLSRGKWVPKAPQNKDRVGWHLSQLFSQMVTAREIIYDFNNTRNITEFYNSTIGFPWIERDKILNGLAELDACIDKDKKAQWENKGDGKNKYVLGADQGDVCHVVIKKILPNGQTQIARLEIIEGPEPFRRIGQLINLFNVDKAVIDAMPNHVNAKKLVRDFLGRVYIAFYNEQKPLIRIGKEKATKETPEVEDGFTIFADRNQSLESAAERFSKRQEVIPVPEACETRIVKHIRKDQPVNLCRDVFFTHLTKLARRIELIDKETGKEKKTIIHLGIDPHFAHANNYCFLAYKLLEARRTEMDAGIGDNSEWTKLVRAYKLSREKLKAKLGREPYIEELSKDLGEELEIVLGVKDYLENLDIYEGKPLDAIIPENYENDIIWS